MEIPQALHEALEQQSANMLHAQMMHDAQAISMRYRVKGTRSRTFPVNDAEAAAYAASRMPATFGAVSAALGYALDTIASSAGYNPRTLLDAGAGTGAAAWAADSMIDLESVICLEREESMLKTGKTLMELGSHTLCDTKWIRRDITAEDIPERADLVIASYVLNELPETERIKIIKKLWDAANIMLLLVEPGTSAGFSYIREARRTLLKCGAHIAAPCPHESKCPIMQDDWCHFTCRVGRSRLHRQLKGGEAPYEDEKFTYMALTREVCNHTRTRTGTVIKTGIEDGTETGIKAGTKTGAGTRVETGAGARILRHPQIHSGHVMLEACTTDGIRKFTLSKKDGEIYKQARKSKSGDMLSYPIDYLQP